MKLLFDNLKRLLRRVYKKCKYDEDFCMGLIIGDTTLVLMGIGFFILNPVYGLAYTAFIFFMVVLNWVLYRFIIIPRRRKSETNR